MKIHSADKLIELTIKFPTDNKWRKHIANIKLENEFICPKCGNKKFSIGDNRQRCCNICKNIESVPAKTLFHKVKLGISQASLIAFKILTSTKVFPSSQKKKLYDKIISVNKPQNLSEKDEHLFVPFLKYNLQALSINNLKNVFVTHSGLCINNKGLVKECHHSYPEQYPNYLNEAAFFYKAACDDHNNLIILDDKNTYLLIHHPWFNYYHWLCEPILRLWMVKDKLKDLVLILPDIYKNTDFIMGSLEPFKIKNIFFIPAQKSLYIKKLCMPQIKPIVHSYHIQELTEIRQFYLNYVIKEKNININLGERLYISRRKATRKKINNEEEIENILVKYNFKIINNEEYDFLQQVAIFSNAKYLISIHGAGLTNMIFMKENAHIFEFHKKKTNEKDIHSLAYWYLADGLGHYYYHQICDPTNKDDNYFNADLIVDLDLLEKNLKLMFSY